MNDTDRVIAEIQTPMPTLPELPKPGFPMMRQKIDGNYLTGEIAGYFTADQMREYALAALATRAQEPLKVSASTERVWRAIYERICFAGEPVADVLADYEEARAQGEAVAWRVTWGPGESVIFDCLPESVVGKEGCTEITPLFAAPVASEDVDLCEVARQLERVHAEHVLAEVEAIAEGRTDAYWCGFSQAVEEIAHRLGVKVKGDSDAR